MNDTIPLAQAVSIPEFHAYEELAHSDLPDNAVVSSKEGKVECKIPGSSLSGVFGGNTVKAEEIADSKKSKEDFEAAVRSKFSGAVDNYVFPTKEEGERAHNEEPLTLGRVRFVIKEASLASYVAQHAKDPSFIDNPQLARLTGSAIMAKEQAEKAAAHLDALGCSREHLEATLQAAGKFLLDAGITVTTVGLAGYLPLMALLTYSGGMPASVVIAGLSWMGEKLYEKNKEPVPETPLPIVQESNLTPENNTPTKEESSSASENNTFISEERIGRFLAAELASTVAIALHSSALFAGMPVALAMWMLTTPRGKEIGQHLAAYLPSVSNSLGVTQEATSKLIEVRKAFVHAVATRVVANELLEEVQQETERGTVFLRGLQTLSELAKKGNREIKNIVQQHGERLPSKVRLIVPRIAEMESLTQKMQAASIVTPAELGQLSFLASENLKSIEAMDPKWRKASWVQALKEQTEEILKLAQEWLESLSGFLSKVAAETVDKKSIQPSLQEIRIGCEQFLNAVVTGIKSGQGKIEELQVEAKETAMPREVQRLITKEKMPSEPRRLPI